METQRWDADLYDAEHSFVTTLGAGPLELLAARPGERVLDLGCGTGDHVAELVAAGVDAIGVDASADMVARAGQKFPGLTVAVADARALPFAAEFDAVFSNAALHWVPQADEVARSVHAALRPGGRFVAELGGFGNIAAVVDGATTLRAELGLPPARSPWYFPTIGQYSTVLERAGLAVGQAWLFDRPTRLESQDGLRTWLDMFAGHLTADAPAGFLDELVERLRPALHRDGSWWVDYRRLRVHARKSGLHTSS